MIAASSNRVLFVEDDETLRAATVQALVLAGFEVTAFADAESALAAIDRSFDGVVVSDIRMPRMDGLDLLARLRTLDPDLSVILVTGHGDVPMAVKALQDGAADLLTKPFATDHLAASIRRALERRALVLENRRLQAAVAGLENDDGLIGESPAMTALRETIHRIAAADVDVLVEGETGTGKELVARLIHREGPRRGRPFIAVNCGALSEATAEIELFGHAADSVPQTRLSRTGQIAASDGGTLLLDEIDSMPPGLQAKLLRVLEEREVQPIGAERPTPLNLHVIATTKSDLAAASQQGNFRPDLYYRLATLRLRVPPVRERGEDRLLLFAAFVAEASATLGREQVALDGAVHARLHHHDWPGNVRELRNFAFEATLGTSTALPARPDTQGSLAEQVAAFEAALIRDALERHRGSVQNAIRELGLPRKTFYDKIARYGISAASFRPAR
ncbi:sigma-54 dependent transcriptional regulator [Sphingomonas sp. dw_22]|uniref:sigma-54-dependent transcriptional regulator n=1 Tax=Sphingomonas sp. dw_22 TaxID=2721175 RepID=UPI001BD4026F|nr:sigma-54 dependent transcriptional regulator [Sphingomonas sp. dw_22]